MTFEETRPWARSIKARVAARQMPPWHIDKAVGIQHFKNDRSLSDKEIDTIVRWVDAGAPKGDPKDMPPPKTFARDDVWNFAELYGGPPDLIVKSPAYTTPAQALDQWFKPVVETGLTETRWVRAIEIRPSTVKGRKVTHHALARLQQDDPDQNLTSDGGGARPVHGVGGREAGRDHAREQRQADAARRQDHLRSALSRGRRGNHRPGRARHLFLSERPGAEVSAGARLAQQRRRRRRATSTFRRTARS